VDARNDHGVGHCRVARLEAVGFGQPQLDVKGILRNKWDLESS
jgi:hypothetical protein